MMMANNVSLKMVSSKLRITIVKMTTRKLRIFSIKKFTKNNLKDEKVLVAEIIKEGLLNFSIQIQIQIKMQ